MKYSDTKLFTHKILLVQFNHLLKVWLFFVSLLPWATVAHAKPTLAQIIALSTEVKAPDVSYGGSSRCHAKRMQVLVTPDHIVHTINFTDPDAIGNCSVVSMVSTSSLESPIGTHPIVAAYDAESGEPASYVKSRKAYLIFNRRGASETDAAQAVFNPEGTRLADSRAYRRSNKTLYYSQNLDVLMAMFMLQDKVRSAQLEKATAEFEAAGGVPAAFAELNGNVPDVDLLKRLFFKIAPLPETPCSQGVFKTLSKLMTNTETSVFLFSPNLVSHFDKRETYANAATLVRMNKTTYLDYQAYTVTNNSGDGFEHSLAIVITEDCKHLYLKAEHITTNIDQNKFGSTEFAEVLADFSSDFVRGTVKNRSYSGVTNRAIFKMRHGVEPAVEFICNRDKCFKGDVVTVFAQGVLKSTDHWPADIKSAIANLEQQRDQKLAANKRDREARETREAQQRRLAEAEAAKRRAAEEHEMNTALQAKDPQVMYLAAGKYEREGESYRARQVYERLIARFPSSQWAVKANDQLLQNRRVDAVNSATQQASSEARDRAYKACLIEMDTCYGQNGKNCYRNCDSLR